MEDRPRPNESRIAEYTAIRNEMQSITVARYTVLALTMTAVAAILSLVPRLDMKDAVFAGPIGITAVLLPSIVMNLTLSRQFHRLSTFNAVFFPQPMFLQQAAFEIYKNKRPAFWGYVKPLALAYASLLVGATMLFLILFWSWQMGIGVALMFAVHLWLIARLWDAGLTGKWREGELKLWNQIRDELVKPLCEK